MTGEFPGQSCRSMCILFASILRWQVLQTLKTVCVGPRQHSYMFAVGEREQRFWLQEEVEEVEQKVVEAEHSRSAARRFLTRFCTPVFLEAFVLTFLAGEAFWPPC